jgi:hypothetical protein
MAWRGVRGSGRVASRHVAVGAWGSRAALPVAVPPPRPRPLGSSRVGTWKLERNTSRVASDSGRTRGGTDDA